MNALYENYLRIKYRIPNDLSVHEVYSMLRQLAGGRTQ